MTRAGTSTAMLVACLLRTAGAGEGLPPILREVGIDQRLGAQVPLELEFRDEAGAAIRLGDCLGGKPAVLVLAYYRCPMLCNEVLNGVLDGLRAVPFDAGKEFSVVVVSFDVRETAELAAAKKLRYVEQYGRPGAARGWHFLTGEQASIDRLTQAVGFRYTYDPKLDQFAHASGIMVLSPEGRIARYFYGVRFPARDLRLGLVEASANKIGSPVDQVLLFCYHYDSSTGKYTAAVMNFVRLGGILTLAMLGTLLVRAWRRDMVKGRIPAGARPYASESGE